MAIHFERPGEVRVLRRIGRPTAPFLYHEDCTVTMPGMTDRAPTIQQQLADWFMRFSPPSGVRRVMPLAAAVATDIGAVRGENQDRVAVARGRTKAGQAFAIAAIADGIGGMKEGASCASNALAELFTSAFRRAQRGELPEICLEWAVRDANSLVHSQSRLSGGTTLVALLLVEGYGAYWASVGDSRLYRASGTELVQLSKDDTIAGQLGRRADIALEQSKLLQFVGIGEPLEIRVEQVDAGANDTALLTTDGVHFLERPGGVFGLVVHNSQDVGTCVRRLTELARWSGGPDNASAVAIPFFPDLLKHPIPSQCLDVWDPFGEIRIVEQPETAELTEQPSRATSKPQSATSEQSDADSKEPSAEESVAVPGPEKTERPKRKRKSRKKTDIGGKASQVQLHFSGKDD